MRLSRIGELRLLETLRRNFKKASARSGLLIGIGDDAAAFRPKNRVSLVTTDMMIEGVHFDLSWTTPFQLGYKLVSVNVSDIYAMGGDPEYLLINFAAPEKTTGEFFTAFFRGIRKAMKSYCIELIGGDISSSSSMMVAATVHGSTQKPVQRRGARVGDSIYLSAPTGDAAAGLSIMQSIGRPVSIEKKTTKLPVKWKGTEPLIRRHLMPLARSPQAYAPHASAMIDISDGLLIDLYRLCQMSGVGAEIHEDMVPVSSSLKKAGTQLGIQWESMVYGGGEDYELLFTSPRSDANAYCIGKIIKSGLFLVDEHGRRRRAPVKGYQHFVIQR